MKVKKLLRMSMNVIDAQDQALRRLLDLLNVQGTPIPGELREMLGTPGCGVQCGPAGMEPVMHVEKLERADGETDEAFSQRAADTIALRVRECSAAAKAVQAAAVKATTVSDSPAVEAESAKSVASPDPSSPVPELREDPNLSDFRGRYRLKH